MKRSYYVGGKLNTDEVVLLAARLTEQMRGRVAEIHWTDEIKKAMEFKSYDDADSFIERTFTNPSDIDKVMFPVDISTIKEGSIDVYTFDMKKVYPL